MTKDSPRFYARWRDVPGEGWRWPHFTPREAAERSMGWEAGDTPVLIVPELFDRAERLRAVLGFPLVASSWYRSPSYNARISTTGISGPHTAAAIDWLVAGERARLLVAAAIDIGFTGLGVHQKGSPATRFVHTDILGPAEGRPRPWIWSY